MGLLANLSEIGGYPTATAKTSVVAASTMRYAETNGLGVEFYSGLVAAFNIVADSNGTDGINVHNTYGAASVEVITINCCGRKNGVYGHTSCNGLTGHENTRLIDIAGNYQKNHGGSIALINQSRLYMLGTQVKNDLGDIVLGGNIPQTGVLTDHTAQIWADHAIVSMPADQRGWHAGACLSFCVVTVP